KPPVGPVVAKAPAGAAPARPAVAVVPPAVTVVVKPPVPPPGPSPAREGQTHVAEAAPAVKPQTPPPAPVAAAPVPVEASAAAPAAISAEPAIAASASDPAPVAAVAAAPAAPRVPDAPPPPPIRRVVMPQTGPRPVYKAPIGVPAASAPAASSGQPGGIQRGRPIFDRRPAGGPGNAGGFTPRPPQGQGAPGQFPGGPRPKHPTRTTPGGYQGAGGPAGPGGR